MFTNKTPWIVLLLLWMGGSTWWHVCKIKQLCGNDPQAASATTAVSMPALSIVDGDRLNLTLPGNFKYARSGVVADATGVGNTLQSLAGYLKSNSDRVLAITGHYQADEQNSSTYPTIGVARAEAIKGELVKLGVPADQLTTKGELADDTNADIITNNAKGDSLYGGLTFAFAGSEATPATDNTANSEATPATDNAANAAPAPDPKLKTEEALAEAQTFTTVFKPIDLYFKLGKSTYIETDATKKFFAEAATYLNANKEKKLILTGYTDNMGPDAVNMNLSRARAATVKRRLRRTGIDGRQIIVAAKGEADPKVSNETLEGRKANRRVTAVVQ